YKDLGKGKTLGLIFMNPSLRTRLSTQKAGINLGMSVMVMNFSGEGWALETEDGTVMDGDRAEHIREAAAVVGQYCDVIGIRSFPGLKDRDLDYSENILNKFVELSGRPVVSLESATRHPLQSLADMATIEAFRQIGRPKVVMSWAPHPKALPQSVPNSFTEWALKMDYDFMITHPEGYELDPEFAGNARIEYDQDKAFEGADFIYVKNWSSYSNYGQVLTRDLSWTVNQEKLKDTNNAKVLHCLPVRRNMVIADDVLDSGSSVVIEEASYREFAAQAVLKEILENN
ncbi:acetylornithine carbamoyltransferase, partial [Bacteroidota bacterium]